MMSKKALFIVPPERFNEVEFFWPKEVLEKAGVEVTIASTSTGEIIGDYQGRVTATTVFSETPSSDYGVVAVMGGSGTNDFLCNNPELHSYIKQAHTEKCVVAGICAGAVAIAETGLLTGRKATCYPVDWQKEQLKAYNAEYLEQHIVVLDDIITADGPEGAESFGIALLNVLN
ncbi:putative cysteine protease YraA [compost metagenome]